MNELVDAVRAYANDNYDTDGWDVLVECWTDDEIKEKITEADAKNSRDAIKACLPWVKLYDEHRRAIMNEAF
jgi:hypothetical protein